MSILTLRSRTTDRGRPEIEREQSPAGVQPIELQTENGFSIIRRCDVDKSSSIGGATHSFIVRDPYGYELDITVDITDASVAEIISRSRGRLTLASSYWIACAERHLATYLWEQEDYPPDAKITVDYLTPDDLDLALRWEADLPEHNNVSPISSTRFEPTKPIRTVVLETDSRSKPTPKPITFLTENGYSIVRVSEVNKSVTDSAQECRFLVENPNGQNREIAVHFGEELIKDIQSRRRRGVLSLASKYWLTMGEKYLGTYLWENNEYPPLGEMTIDQLSGDDLLLAAHWKDGWED